MVDVVTDPDERTHPHYSEVLLSDYVEHFVHAALLKASPDEILAQNKYDLVVVATWHTKLPVVPNMFNVHPGKLPEYRGATPTYWAILNGESITAVTIHGITNKFDAGPIYYELAHPIWDNTTDGQLRRELADLAEILTWELVRALIDEKLPVPRDQPFGGHSYKKRASTVGEIRFGADMSALRLHNLIRAATPWPGAWTTVGPETDRAGVLIYKSEICAGTSDSAPGTVVAVEASNVYRVATADGILRLLMSKGVPVGTRLRSSED